MIHCGFKVLFLDIARTPSNGLFRLRCANQRPIRIWPGTMAAPSAHTAFASTRWKYMALWYGSFDAAAIGTVDTGNVINGACFGHGFLPF